MEIPTVEEILKYGYYTWNARPGEAEFYTTCNRCTSSTMEDLKQDEIWGQIMSHPGNSIFHQEFYNKNNNNDDEEKAVEKHPNDKFFLVE